MKARLGIRVAVLLVALLASIFMLQALLGIDEECLVYGENCSASYKEANFGTRTSTAARAAARRTSMATPSVADRGP